MSEYNYGPLEHELAGGQCADDCHFGDRDEPPAPRAVERDEHDEADSLKSLSTLLKDPSYMTLPRACQIAIKHAHWNATTLPNNEFSLSWQDTKVLLDEYTFLTDRLAAQTESLTKVVSERNELREQREQLIAALKQVRAMFFEDARAGANVVDGELVFNDDELHPWIPGARAPKAITLIDDALATVEREGEGTR